MTDSTPLNHDPAALAGHIAQVLSEGKAEDIISIDLMGKTSIADHLVIASGRSTRQVSALCDQILDSLRGSGVRPLGVEGKEHGDWVLVDLGDVIVHLFRPEVRLFYNLEKMWTDVPVPLSEARA